MTGQKRTNTAHLDTVQSRVKPILDLVDELRSMGVDKHVTLPQIAVMGDQSSGKSSVLEALSGIAFPRGAGLVTRCPTQVNMRSGSTWKATISCPAIPNVRRTLTEEEQDEIPGQIESITNKLAGDEEGFPDWANEKNYILIDLVAPNAPELTIIDLPGIIRTTMQGQNNKDIKTIDDMLDYFLKKPRTCILAVIPANVDLATSEILERASRVDPDGSRTIGVLTKPDLVDKGAEDEVIKVLRNIKRPLKRGYFMLKNRSQNQVNQNITFEEARKSEMDFFANSPYFEVKRDNLGSFALSSALTDLLVSHIEIALPEIREEIDHVLKGAHQRLLELGESPPKGVSAMRKTFFSVVREIIHDMRAEMSGDNSARGLLKNERTFRQIFAKEVIDTEPGFDGEYDVFCGKLISVGKDDSYISGENVEYEIDGTPGTLVKEFSLSEEDKQSTTPLGTIVCCPYLGNYFFNVEVTGYVRYFRGELRDLIESRRGRELPGFMNFKVFTSLMTDYVNLWKKPTDIYETSVNNLMLDFVRSLSAKHIKNYPLVGGRLNHFLEKFFMKNREEITRRLAKLLEQECSPSTENQYLWDTINKLRNERIEDKIESIPDASVFGRNKESLDGYVSKSEIIAMLKSNIEGDASNEAQEVQDMIDMLSAYWQLAVKRYIDQVAMCITDIYTHPDICKTLDADLHEEIMNISEDELTGLFSQKRQIIMEREELEHKVEMMKGAKERLEKF
eukprot:Tbor_TRINITY_DN5693_c1_g1::TRINITY_DN5693_c1_g1_i8::g.9265::m.9265/K14754/MX1; interferon-induced GTP-binding protein Mx1